MTLRYALRELAGDLAATPPHPYEAKHIRLARELLNAAQDWSPEGRAVARRIERQFVKDLFAALAKGDPLRRSPTLRLVPR